MTSCAKEPEPLTPPIAPLEVAVPPQPPAPPPATGPVGIATQPDPGLPTSASEGNAGGATTELDPAQEGLATSSAIDQYDPAGKHTCSELRCPPSHPFAEGLKVLMHDCRGLERDMKPEPFQRFIQCMLRQNNTRATCDLLLVGTDPGDCLVRWSEPKALEPQTAATCAPIVQRCARRPAPKPAPPRFPQHRGGHPPPSSRPAPPARTLSMIDCEGILTVTKERARPRMVACMNEYCEDAPHLCYMSLSSP